MKIGEPSSPHESILESDEVLIEPSRANRKRSLVQIHTDDSNWP
jgi:hypothetical protein